MSHTVAVGEFEGPLGVLLDLVERKRLPVSEIAVGAITTEYLEKIKQLPATSVEDLSEFLQLGARLVYIKSLALLPAGPEAGQQAVELAALRAELAQYKQFQEAAKLLKDRGDGLRTWERPAVPRPLDAKLPANLTLEQLAAAFSRALQAAPVAKPAAVIHPHLSLEKVISDLRNRLKDGFELQEVIANCRDRLEVIVTFLAVLELVRGGKAAVRQAGQFDPIRVETAHA